MCSQSKHQKVCFEHYTSQCVVCGSVEDIEVHHIDGDSSNNERGNLIPLCQSCHWDVENECYTDDVDARITSTNPLIRWLIKRKRQGSPRQDSSIDNGVMVSLSDSVRDELRKYKAQEGLTYNQAVQELLQKSGWYND